VRAAIGNAVMTSTTGRTRRATATAPSDADAQASTHAIAPPDAQQSPTPPIRRFRRRRVVVPAVVVVLVLVALWIVVFSPVLGVRTIRVRGLDQLSAAAVEHAAAISPGTPLLRLDAGAAARRVEQLPGIRSAQVSTSFPSTVTITVVERRPVGWLQAGKRYVLVDSTGARYREVAHRPRRLPHLVLPNGAGTATTAAVATVAAALPPTLLPRIASVQALDPTAITLLLRGDRVVQWGSAASSPAKARVLPALLRTGATQINVSDPAQPFVH
jgi:cell division protein FtsQ